MSPRAAVSWPVLRDAVAVAAIAVVTVQALRRFVADYYLVPTGSMEPILHGDPARGDVVLVDKLAGARARRRGDLVVVEHPVERGHQLVKRIVACGDEAEACWIDIRQGDIWLGPDPQHLEREAKDPLLARRQQVPWAQRPGGGASEHLLDLRAATPRDGEPPWRLDPAWGSLAEARSAMRPEALRSRRERTRDGSPLPAGCIGTARAVDAGYLDALGRRVDAAADVTVSDCSLTLALGPGPCRVVGTVESRAEAVAFVIDFERRRIELWRNGQDVADAVLPELGDGVRRWTFGLLDDRFYCCVDDRRDALFVWPRQPNWRDEREAELPMRRSTCLHVGVIGDQPAAIMSIAVHRDVFAWREPVLGMPGEPGKWPRFVPAGHWFLLGDNAFDSLDSRHYGPVPATSCLGAPRLVLGPWPRTRWLP